MNKHQLGAKIVFGVFIIGICLLVPWGYVFRKKVDTTNYENREMAEKPHLTKDSYLQFSDDYTAYFNDRIPFRNALIQLNNSIDYRVFKKSPSPDVLLGKDKWLFYVKESDGDPIRSYSGNDLYTDAELSAFAQNCVAQRDYLLSQGKEFVIFIAPNKERVYSEYMPSLYGRPAKNYRALQVYNFLKENTDIKVVYPYAELIEAKKSLTETIYYKTDSHWNYIGAYVAATALLEELGVDMPKIGDDRISIVDTRGFSGDLIKMLNLPHVKFDDREYTVTGYELHNAQIEPDPSFYHIVSYTAENADPRCIYVIRDSYASHMYEFIGSQFNSTVLRHNATYTNNDLETYNPDIVVYETVERRLGKLATFSVQ